MQNKCTLSCARSVYFPAKKVRKRRKTERNHIHALCLPCSTHLLPPNWQGFIYTEHVSVWKAGIITWLLREVCGSQQTTYFSWWVTLFSVRNSSNLFYEIKAHVNLTDEKKVFFWFRRLDLLLQVDTTKTKEKIIKSLCLAGAMLVIFQTLLTTGKKDLYFSCENPNSFYNVNQSVFTHWHWNVFFVASVIDLPYGNSLVLYWI